MAINPLLVLISCAWELEFFHEVRVDFRSRLVGFFFGFDSGSYTEALPNGLVGEDVWCRLFLKKRILKEELNQTSSIFPVIFLWN